MTQASWGDGEFKASWNGIGGAPYFVQDLEVGTLRLPDLRGMFACAAGDGNYGPNLGGVMGIEHVALQGQLVLSRVAQAILDTTQQDHFIVMG